MSDVQDTSVEPVVSNVELSDEPISTEIGSGAIEAEAKEAAGINTESIDGEVLDKLSEVVEGAIEEGASDEEVKTLVKKYMIKVNGEEKEVELDFNNEADIIRRLQMAEAGQGAMQRASEMEKQFGNEINRLKTDPWAVLEELGIDTEALAEDRIQQTIDQLQKSPEQLAQEAQAQELEDLRERLRNEEDSKRDIQFQQLQKQAEIDLDSEITDALSATTELPKSPYVMKRVADALMFAMDNGYKDVKAADVIPTVEKEINEELRQFLESMPDKVLEQYMGNKITDRLRKQRLSKMPKNLSSVKDTGKVPDKEENTPTKRQSIRDFMKNGIR